MKAEHRNKNALGIALIGFGSFFLVTGFMIATGLFIAIWMMGGIVETEQELLAEIMENGVETVGTVIYADDDGTKISYRDEEGNDYQTAYTSYYSKYGTGAEIAVYYDKENPNNCRVPGMTIEVAEMISGIIKLVGGIVIGVLLLIGLSLIIGGSVFNKRVARSYDL